MPYIGRSSNFGVRTRFLYTATASQTTFSGTDTQNLTLSYSDSNFIDVHQNGVLLKVVDDYTATSGTSVVLATGATASDVIEITVYDVFSIANHIKKTGDAMAGALTNIDIDGTELVLDADGDTSITADTDDQIDIRIAGADDFRFTANTFTALSGSTIAAQALTATTIGATGVVTANAGVVVDNITIDGTEIDLSSGDLTLDVAGDLILDVDGGDVHFQDSGQSNRFISIKNSSGSCVISNPTADGDITFQGNDDGVGAVNALVLDMSTGGTATFAKNVTITDGDLVIGTSGHGISFAATSDGSGTDSSELLDDYEEGTWTPAINSGGSTLGIIANTAIYTKIGRFVHVQVYATSLASTTSSGFRISGLPYTNLSTGQTVGSIMYQNIDIPGSRTQMVAYAPSSSDIIRLYGVGDNTTWQEITGTNTGTSFNMIINLQYTT